VLHRLFRAALQVSKQIAEKTGVGRGNISIAGAAADLASRVFQHLSGARVLVLGAGETAELVVSHLAGRGVSSFRVLNRTLERAQELGARWDADVGSLDQITQYLPDADVLVCAAPGNPAHVDVKQMRRALRHRRGRPIVVIDIAMPRGIDTGIDSLDNVYRYDMETLTEVTKDALRHRRSDFIQCCTLVDATSLNLLADTRAHRAGEAIAELERTYESVAADELKELEDKLPPEARAHVRKSVRRIVRRLLHLPKRALRASDPEESELIRRVFTGRDDE
jgi:glutamyl-tRNA reductase